MKRWKQRSALALPFVIGALSWCALRLAVAPVGDAIASSLVRVVPPVASVTPEIAPEIAPIPDPTDEQLESVGALPRRVASQSGAPHRASGGEGTPPSAPAADGAPTLASLPVGDAPKATIFVPAALVARALERRDVGATNAITPDGARLVGVSKYRTGLRDGDVVVSVAGTRTPNVSAMTTAALQAAGGVAPRITGRILRGDATITVVLELPR
jgi:hypothetical protein